MMKQSPETTGTGRRAPRHPYGRGTVFEPGDELRDLRRDLQFTSGDRAANTLAKTDGLRVSLVLLKYSASFYAEAAAGGATLHVLKS